MKNRLILAIWWLDEVILSFLVGTQASFFGCEEVFVSFVECEEDRTQPNQANSYSKFFFLNYTHIWFISSNSEYTLITL